MYSPMTIHEAKARFADFDARLRAYDFGNTQVLVICQDEPTVMTFANAIARRISDGNDCYGYPAWWYGVFAEHQGSHYFHSTEAHVYQLIQTEIPTLEEANEHTETNNSPD